jgi:hypothetical protein
MPKVMPMLPFSQDRSPVPRALLGLSRATTLTRCSSLGISSPADPAQQALLEQRLDSRV